VVGLPRSRLAVLPGTTHAALMERTGWLLAMVGEFLNVRAAVAAGAPTEDSSEDADPPGSSTGPGWENQMVSRSLATSFATSDANPKGIRGVSLWRRRESNPCEGSEQKRGVTRTYPPNP
jgi:hypothetical protein